MDEPRTIIHADMDAFYASVEQRDDPALRGRPVVVGGPSRRGVVAAASYEARVHGIHSAMPMAQAQRRCRELVVLPPRFAHYEAISHDVFAIFGDYSPLVEPLSLDEAFVDISGTRRLHGDPRGVAQRIKEQVREHLDLVVSVGVAPSKFVAKVASDLGKPDGLVVVEAGEVRRFLEPLPVSRIFGVGQVTQQALESLGLRTMGAVASYSREALRGRLGEHGEQIWHLARGEDDRPVEPDREAQSVGHENTFDEDRGDPAQLRLVLLEQGDRVGRRLRQHGLCARTVVLKVRTADFRLYTRRRRLPRPCSDGGALGRAAGELLVELMRTHPGPFRLTGVTGADLCPDDLPGQLSLDEPDHARRDRLLKTLDAIDALYGEGTVQRATTLLDRRRGATK